VEPKYLRPDKGLKDIVLDLARKSLEGQTIENIGQIIAILDVEMEELGEIKLRNPNVFFNILMETLVFRPLKNEVVIGKVESITESSVYLNIGSIDAILPVNQISDERYKFIARRRELRGSKSKIIIRKGDWIRAKVSRVSFKVPTEISALVRGGIIVSAPRRISPKTEINIVLRSKDRGLGLEKVLEKMRKELISM